jgi:hypothetical protein
MIAVVCLMAMACVCFVIYEIVTDPWNEMYKDRIEYPLAKVDINDTAIDSFLATCAREVSQKNKKYSDF